MAMRLQFDSVLQTVGEYAKGINQHVLPEERGILLYMAARAAMLKTQDDGDSSARGGSGSKSKGGAQTHKQAPVVDGHDGFDGQEATALEDTLDTDVLAFIKPTPFERKSAESVLGSPSPAAVAAASSDAGPLVLDPVAALIKRGQTMSLSDDFLLKGRALAMLVGAPMANDPVTGLGIEPNCDWIGSSLEEASAMVAAPKSSDNTVIGFNAETLSKVEQVEELMNSPQPALAARAFEQVIAARLTPKTTPEDLRVDMSDEEMDGYWSQLES
jgi:hypothetical protein